MDLPRLIHLDEETEQKLSSYIEQELINHYAERGVWVDELKDIQVEYIAEPSKTPKSFPFKGAANLIIPLIATVVEALHAKTMTQLFALDDFVTVKVPEQAADINWGLTKLWNYELLENGVDMYKFADSTMLENYKFGSTVGKVGYDRVEKTAVKMIGDKEHEFTVVTKEGACADGVHLERFLMPFYCQDPQTAPWCGEEHLVSSYEFESMYDAGYFYDDAVDIIESWVRNSQSTELSSFTYEQKMRELQNMKPVWPKEIGFVEMWMCFNVDKDPKGKKKEIVVYYHKLSCRIIGIRYNWNDDLRRPYRTGKYFNVEHRWTGIGVGKQVKVFQREVTIQHRQRLDNATIANIRMFKVNKLAGYGPGEPIFPGKLWFVDNMDDIESLEAGEVYPSSFNDEVQTLQYAQQRSGVNELNLGMPQAGTPGTATSDMTRLQEGSRKYDYGMLNNRRFLTDISRDVAYTAIQFGVSNVDIFSYIPSGDAVRSFLDSVKSSPSLIRSQLLMNIKLITQSENKVQERASWTQLSGQLTQYYTEMFNFAMQLKDPNLIGMLAKFIPSGATETMQQILQTFDVPNIERIIPQELILGYKPQITNPSLLLGNPDEGSDTNPPAGGNSGVENISSQSGNGNPGGGY